MHLEELRRGAFHKYEEKRYELASGPKYPALRDYLRTLAEVQVAARLQKLLEEDATWTEKEGKPGRKKRKNAQASTDPDGDSSDLG